MYINHTDVHGCFTHAHDHSCFTRVMSHAALGVRHVAHAISYTAHVNASCRQCACDPAHTHVANVDVLHALILLNVVSHMWISCAT